MEKIHEEEGIGPDMLMGDVLYYGDNHSWVVSFVKGESWKHAIYLFKTHDVRNELSKLSLYAIYFQI